MNVVKTALVVEGGGLRGAFPAGVLQVLLARFGPDAFDGIFTVSSGVFASTFFIAGQGAEMEAIWRDRVCGHQLVDHRNWLTGKPVLRLDYLIDLFKGPAKLDLGRVMNSRPYLEYVLTDYGTHQPVHLDAKCDDIFDLIRASSALPHIYPLPVSIRGRHFYDGGQSDPIPVQRALQFGATHIVVVRTRPAGYVKKPALPWQATTPLAEALQRIGAADRAPTGRAIDPVLQSHHDVRGTADEKSTAHCGRDRSRERRRQPSDRRPSGVLRTGYRPTRIRIPASSASIAIRGAGSANDTNPVRP